MERGDTGEDCQTINGSDHSPLKPWIPQMLTNLRIAPGEQVVLRSSEQQKKKTSHLSEEICHDDANCWKSTKQFGQTFQGTVKALTDGQAEATTCQQHPNEPNKKRLVTSPEQVDLPLFSPALSIPTGGASAEGRDV